VTGRYFKHGGYMQTLEGALQERLDGIERSGTEKACIDQKHLDRAQMKEHTGIMATRVL
jgi:hypothetical protein